jgi:hypothetical protein
VNGAQSEQRRFGPESERRHAAKQNESDDASPPASFI